MAQSIAHFLPEQAILVDEGATTTIPLWEVCNSAATHDWLALTGGAIGFGLPAAVGAAVACPAEKLSVWKVMAVPCIRFSPYGRWHGRI